MIQINPKKISQLSEPEGATFCLVTNPDLVDKLKIVEEGGYENYLLFEYSEQGQIKSLLENDLPQQAHVLVISPGVFFRSPEQEWIGPHRKIIAMACNSTITSLNAIEHFLRIIENTNDVEQEQFADRFFDDLESCEQLIIKDETYGVSATFDHYADEYTWNQQAGVLNWGEQQLAPSGEISVLPSDIWDFSPKSGMEINGEIALRGTSILHSGEPSFLREDQHRIWKALSTMEKSAVIAKVEHGFITEFRSADSNSEAAATMLNHMSAVDSRYRLIEELGFGCNTHHEIFAGNVAMNEVYGGNNGILHIGLGLTPYTQYHLDIICPGIKIYANNSLIFGTLENKAA